MNAFFIRTAGKGDLPAISQLLRTTWAVTYDGIYGPEHVAQIGREWHSVGALKPRLNRPGSEFLVADDGHVIGGVAFAAVGAGDTKMVMLHQLYVLPELQRKGIGHDLLAEVEASFPEAERIRIEVEERNEGALRFYVREGFQQIAPAASEAAGLAEVSMLVLEKRLG